MMNYPSEVLELNVFQLDVGSLIAEDDTAGSDGHVLKGVLAVVAESWSLDSRHLKADLQPVDYQSRQGLTVDVLGDDDEGSLLLKI